MSNTPENPESQSAPHPEHTNQQHRRQRAVVLYVSVLFLAAFVLLSLSFMMERRQNAESLDDLNQSLTGLKDSVSAMQSVQQLYEENAALKEQLEQLEDKVAAQDHTIIQLERGNEELTTELDRTRQAMDWFWQIDEAYVRGKYGLCRTLIGHMEDDSQGAALKEALPKESATANGRFSPADRYQEIYNKLY